jgi:hypothetical protein
MKDLETLAYELDRYGAADACQQLISRFFDLHTQGRNKEVVALFADREDNQLEMPWGVYVGKKGIERCFLEDYGDVSDPEVAEKMKGRIDVHTFGTSIIEFDDENKIGRAIGNGPGFETFVEEDGAKAFWSWAKFGMDFIKEEGEWKIWSFKIYPLFCSPYDVAFVDYEKAPYEGVMTKTQIDHPLDQPLFSYDPKRPLPDDEPVIIKPFSKYEDLGYIW